MPSSAVRTFTDPDEYAEAVRGGTVEMTAVGRGDFSAKVTRIELHRLWMNRFSENLPRVVEVAAIKERTYIAFRVQPGPSLLQAGVEIPLSGILRQGQALDYYQRSSGPVNFGAMSPPIEDVASVGETMSGRDLRTPRETTIITPPRAAVAKLQRLHAAAGQLAEDAPRSSPIPKQRAVLSRR